MLPTFWIPNGHSCGTALWPFAGIQAKCREAADPAEALKRFEASCYAYARDMDGLQSAIKLWFQNEQDRPTVLKTGRQAAADILLAKKYQWIAAGRSGR